MADSKITALREKVACFGDRQAPFRSWLTDLRQTAVSPYAHFHMHKIRIIPVLKYYKMRVKQEYEIHTCVLIWQYIDIINTCICFWFLRFLLFLIMCIRVSIWVHECRECTRWPGVLDSPGSRVAGSCELPDEGARNPTLAFWKSSQGL